MAYKMYGQRFMCRYQLVSGYKLDDLIGASFTSQDIYSLYREDEMPEGAIFTRQGKTYRIIKGKLKEVKDVKQ